MEIQQAMAESGLERPGSPGLNVLSAGSDKLGHKA
jgi:hypothetical protein